MGFWFDGSIYLNGKDLRRIWKIKSYVLSLAYLENLLDIQVAMSKLRVKVWDSGLATYFLCDLEQIT